MPFVVPLEVLGIDDIGIKMKGAFSKLWTKLEETVIGPQLVNEGQIYQVINFDYNFGKLWLEIIC